VVGVVEGGLSRLGVRRAMRCALTTPADPEILRRVGRVAK
jgi:hypothetical protein